MGKKEMHMLLGLEPPAPGQTIEEWARGATLMMHQTRQMAKALLAIIEKMAPVLLSDETPLPEMLTSLYVGALAAALSGEMVLKANNITPINYQEHQRSMVRDLLADKDLPEGAREALLKYLSKDGDEPEDSEWPSEIVMPSDLGVKH